MGLDWNPGPKAKPEHEQEFRELWRKLQARSCFLRSRKLKRFAEITSSTFETLNTPRVGFDAAANDWAREAFPKRTDKSLSLDAFLERMKGFYVLDIIPPCDGLAQYTNGHACGYVEGFSFRAQYLRLDCVDIIGDELVESAYNSKLPEETFSFGKTLMDRASQYAVSHSINLADVHFVEDEDSPIHKLDIVLAAGRWCRFWGEKG